VKIRRYQDSDLEEVNELWVKHHSHAFSLPPLSPNIVTCVALDEATGKIIAFGVVKVYAEAVMVMNHDERPRTLVRAFRELMSVAIMGCQKFGITQLHAVAQDPNFADVLRRQYNFEDVLGDHLKMEV
jgi:hypothetical protein